MWVLDGNDLSTSNPPSEFEELEVAVRGRVVDTLNLGWIRVVEKKAGLARTDSPKQFRLKWELCLPTTRNMLRALYSSAKQFQGEFGIYHHETTGTWARKAVLYDMVGSNLSFYGPDRYWQEDIRIWADGTDQTSSAVTYGSDGYCTFSTAPGIGATYRSVVSGAISAASSVSIAAPAGLANNDLLLAFAVITAGSGVTITPPSGWTSLVRSNLTTSLAVEAFYKLAGSSEPANYSWTFSQNVSGYISQLAIDQVNTSFPVDTWAAQQNVSSTTATAPAVRASNKSNLLVCCFGGVGNLSAVTPPSGMTERVELSASGTTIEVATLGLSARGSTGSKAATWGSAGASIGVSVIVNQALVEANYIYAPVLQIVGYRETADNRVPDAYSVEIVCRET